MSTYGMSSVSAPAFDRVALVTGGAIRVGAAIVRTLAREGWRVWVHHRSSHEQAQALARELGPAVLGLVRADLRDAAARTKLCNTVVDQRSPSGGRLDLLVNSAASFEHGSFLQRQDDQLERVLQTNFVAPVSLVRGLAGPLASANGCVVNVLDLASHQAWPGYLDHCSAKAALAMATRVLAIELAPSIRVNGVSPGTVLWPDDTRYAPGSPVRERIVAGIPLGTIGTPEDVSGAIVYLAAAKHVTGHVLVVDGGRSAAGGREYG